MIDYHIIFKSCPGNYMILRADEKFTVAEVSDYHVKLLGRERNSLIGFGLFECYPPNLDNNWDANSAEKLAESLKNVLKCRTKQGLIARYDVFNLESKVFEPRYWTIDNYPILVNNKIEYILNTSIEVTEIYKHGFNVK